MSPAALPGSESMTRSESVRTHSAKMLSDLQVLRNIQTESKKVIREIQRSQFLGSARREGNEEEEGEQESYRFVNK